MSRMFERICDSLLERMEQSKGRFHVDDPALSSIPRRRERVLVSLANFCNDTKVLLRYLSIHIRTTLSGSKDTQLGCYINAGEYKLL